MPHEILGELICLGVEAGLEVASEDKKDGCGCWFVLALVIGGLIAAYYFS